MKPPLHKPPDPYKCKKTILKNIVKDTNVIERIEDGVIRMHNAVINVFQFMKAFYLYQLKNDIKPPNINKQFIKNCFLVCCENDNRGPLLKEKSINELRPLNDFYNNEFSKVVKEKPNIKKLNQIKNYCIISMMTAFNNNISIHFIDRVFRYINKIFPKDDKHELRKVKNDLLNNINKTTEMTCDKKYHQWIKDNRKYILPKSFNKSYYYDVKCSPSKYLPFMININNELEKIERKQFHCFPLRNDCVPKHIEIDTSALLELLIDKNSKQFRSGEGQIDKSKRYLWQTFFKLKRKIFKYNNDYAFDFTIITDGIGVSIRFIHNDYEKKFGKKEIIKQEKDDYPYLDELDDNKINEICDNNCLYIDPNKSNLIYCMDNNDKIFRYTRAQRLKETERLKNQKIINKYKNQHNLKSVETTISTENSKTCNYEKFMKYIKIKQESNIKLFEYYKEPFIRKIKLRTYINTQRSESKLINNIKNTYGENVKIFFGNGGVNPSMKHIISTPNKRIKRLLNKYFELFHLDEFRTSCLDYRTTYDDLIRNETVKIKTKDGKNKKLHAVLVSKILNKSSGCMLNSYQQRDHNSVLNMRKIVKEYLQNKTRPYWYRRNIKLPDRVT